MDDIGLDDAANHELRSRMVATQVEARGVTDPSVLKALREVPRHVFVPESHRHRSYDDGAFSIGEGQTISQPYIVGLMTALIRPSPLMRVLEVGTGSGFQTAVLARCVGDVFSIENHANLARRAEALLRELGIGNVHFKVGDGFDGWAEHAPFDAIVVTAAPRKLPQPLLDQLKVGGRLVAPVGESGSKQGQELVVVTRNQDGWAGEKVGTVMFVPMTGKAEAN